MSCTGSTVSSWAVDTVNLLCVLGAGYIQFQADTGLSQWDSSLEEAGTQEGLGNSSNSSEFLQGYLTHSVHFMFLQQNSGVPSGRSQRTPLLKDTPSSQQQPHVWGPFWKVPGDPAP